MATTTRAEGRTGADPRSCDEEDARRLLLASIVASSDDAITSHSLDGTITSWNPAAERIYGYPAAEILGQSFSRLIHADRGEEQARIHEEIRAGRRVEHYETVRLRSDGTSISVSLTVSPTLGADGRINGASCIARDITERKRAEEKARTTSLYARSLIEASLDPLVTISPGGKITDVNEGTVKVTGVRRGDLIGTDFSDYFTEPAKAREGYQQVFARGFVTDYPLTIRHRDGRLADVLYNGSVYKDASGTVLGVFAAARDVTAQKRAEAVIAEQRSRELERSEELERFQKQYARSLIEASPDALVTISPEGVLTDVNEGTIRATGVPREELIGTDFSNYFTDPEQAGEGYRRVFEKGIVTDLPLTIRHRDGRVTEVLYSASLYKDARGGVLGVFAAARDVTAQKRAEAVIAEQRKEELERMAELERFQKLTVGRELKMIELKREILELQKGAAGA
jgi:PAS domain S-box-containing protein